MYQVGGSDTLGFEIESAEQERRLADVELGEPTGRHLIGDVTLEARLVRTARAHVGVRTAHALGGRAHDIEPVVGGVDVRLFLGDLVAQLGFVGVGQLPPSKAV